MDKLQPYKEIADRVFQKKLAITSDEDSLTVFFQTCGKESPSFVLDDGANAISSYGLLELRFLFSAFEEFDLSVHTNHEQGVFGFTFRRLKSDMKIPAVFDYPDESEQRCPDYFTEPLPDVYNPPPPKPALKNTNLGGFRRLNTVVESVNKAFEGIPFSVEDYEPMPEIEDDIYEIFLSFGFLTQRVFRFTDEKLNAWREALDATNSIGFSFGNYEGGYVLTFTFGINDVRF